MKIAVIGDIHFSCRNGNEHIRKNIQTFIEKVLFPELKSRQITQIIQTGDLYDNRKSNQNISVNHSKEIFFDKLQEIGVQFDAIVGNHDMMYLHDTTKNTPKIYLQEYLNVKIYDKPTTVNYDGVDIDLIPWICDTNKDEILQFIKSTNSNICVGHFEINGFEMSKNHLCEHGLARELFNSYHTVLSGHFHSKSKSGNILYVGSPTQTTYGEIDDIKGFHILDTEDMSIEFIENPYNLYQKIQYDDNITEADIPDVNEKYVRILTPEKIDEEKYKKFLDFLQEKQPIEIKATETKTATVDSEVSLADIENGAFSIVDFISEYIQNNNEGINKDDVYSIVAELYSEAMSEDV